MQRENRHATADEMMQMKSYVSRAMQAGAFGMSSGLVYIPGAFAPPEELVALANVVKEYKGFYASHMRTESEGVIEAVKETIEVGKQTGIPVHISHHKVAGPAVWGQSKDTLALVETGRQAGLDITLDQYPYTASNTNLGVLFPAWALAGGQEAFVKRMQDPEVRARVKAGVIDILRKQRSGEELWRIVISRFAKDNSLEGKSFEQVLKERGKATSLENAAELAIELQLAGGGRGIYHTMDDADVERIMTYPHTSVASDGRGTRWQVGNPHPRNYGTYPRLLGHYVRDKQVLSLPVAIKKMTSMPADRMGLVDRGVLEVGKQADVVIFHPDTVSGQSTFDKPHQYAIGMKYVFVNGKAVIDEEAVTGVRSGAVLRHQPEGDS
jgi:dihydroorotase/N-acyl-D-amino-acid deacylase